VIDISSPRFKDQIKSVEIILSDLNLHNIPLIRVLNKRDLVDRETINRLSIDLDGTPISAINRSTLMPLIEKMGNAIQHLRKFY
jgi:GTP-binding protein HflX